MNTVKHIFLRYTVFLWGLLKPLGYETGQFAETVEFYRKTLEADASFEGVHRELGKAYISLREDAKAAEELRKAGPGDGEALYFLGALLSRSRAQEAVPLLEKAGAMNPGFWGPPYYLGRLYASQTKWKLALPLLERAAKLNPEEPAVQYQLGRALIALGREAEGRAALARVRELEGRSVQREVDVLSRERP